MACWIGDPGGKDTWPEAEEFFWRRKPWKMNLVLASRRSFPSIVNGWSMKLT